MYESSIDALRARYKLALDCTANYRVVGRVLFTRISGDLDGGLVGACYEAQLPLARLLDSDGRPWAELLVFSDVHALDASAVDEFSRFRASDIPRSTIMAIVIGTDSPPELERRIREQLQIDGTPNAFFCDVMEGIVWIERELNAMSSGVATSGLAKRHCGSREA